MIKLNSNNRKKSISILLVIMLFVLIFISILIVKVLSGNQENDFSYQFSTHYSIDYNKPFPTDKAVFGGDPIPDKETAWINDDHNLIIFYHPRIGNFLNGKFVGEFRDNKNTFETINTFQNLTLNVVNNSTGECLLKADNPILFDKGKSLKVTASSFEPGTLYKSNTPIVFHRYEKD